MSSVSLALALSLWGLVHSILASRTAKGVFLDTFGKGVMRLYRLGYNLFAGLSFLPILYLILVLPDHPLYNLTDPWNFLMRGGQAFAALMLVVGVLHTDTLSFIGLRQLFIEEQTGQLVTGGLYRFVRHPLYTFGLLFLWCNPNMTLNTLTVTLGLTVYTFIGAYFEERRLLREFGQAYVEYKNTTPMLVPGLIFRGNK
jgi:protein-S-isoprenylcysteine O-methyltransferase Ste14